jgi:hypothetical protein
MPTTFQTLPPRVTLLPRSRFEYELVALRPTTSS